MGTSYTISQIAKSAGVGIETIRFYQRKKLVETPTKKSGSIRTYAKLRPQCIMILKAYGLG